MPEKIKCHHCHGKGFLALSSHLEEALSGLKTYVTPASPSDLVGYVDATAGAISNRLCVLEGLGLVTSVKVGKSRIYSLAKKKPARASRAATKGRAKGYESI